ncbi:universal stress protein [Halobacteriovorax sp. GB3]|uniref:universal stress protein n=1 Tax=Halobacteriovorax sp. GB3 TaxID=2719615 RepID=UPI00236271F7|nr:universal stress protein [Halobacteriovorax sp. GB3]MDD0853394.1 universal stress protein [Halobacteriovorax sp. GB3]
MKNIVICASLNDHSLDLLKLLKGNDLLKDAKLHFVHCFEIQIYTSDFSPYVFPTEEKYPEIETSSKAILGNLAKEICTEEQLKNADFQCFFSHSPKERVREYLKESNADLVVVATRGKHGIEGLFSSSFAEHLLKYSPCDIHIMRPKDEE